MFRNQPKLPKMIACGIALQLPLLAAPSAWAAATQNVSVVNTPSVTVTGTPSVTVSSGNVNANVSGSVDIGNTASNPVPAQIVLPSSPFSMEYLTAGNGQTIAFGPGNGQRFAMTAITIANTQTVAADVEIFSAYTVSGNCTGNTSHAGAPNSFVVVPPMQTLHLEYATPVVYPTGCVGVYNIDTGYVGSGIFVTGHGYSAD